MIDGFGRKINYLRLSVTDRCNLKCYYCSSPDSPAPCLHKDILSYEECSSLIRLSGSLGVSKVRLTGGEPFVRKDFIDFVSSLRAELPELDLRVTTNGTLLGGVVSRLADIGIQGLNISLDTLSREKYQRITGRDYFTRVRQAIDDCLEQGVKVKINCVALNGFNDSELADFVRFAQDHPIDIRFIEFMPVGEGTVWGERYFWSADSILADIQKLVALEPVDPKSENHGPARMYSLAEGQGRIGLISPLSNHFCASCNRFRITPDGRLRTCLFSDQEYDLRSLLRSAAGPEAVLKLMREAGVKKPIGHDLLQTTRECVSVCGRRMSTIGG